MGMSLQNVFPSNGRTRDSILSIGEFSVTRLGDFCTLGDHSKPVATIILAKSPTLLGNFCKCVKMIHFSSEIIFG